MRNTNLKKTIQEYLDVPLKAIEGDENKNIEIRLGDFLVDNGYITGIEKHEKDWGFVYYSITRKIALSDKEMPHCKWEDCIFKMGINQITNENLFPSPGIETKKYRFLHEANHAYQEYLCNKENNNNPQEWHQKALQKEINSPYAKLFNFCFYKRKEADENRKQTENKQGLSVWGNASTYNYKGDNDIPNKLSEIAVRSQEDANELITMYLWHPLYLNMYLDYLSLNYNNYQIREKELTQEDLQRYNLIRLIDKEVNILHKLIESYIVEMKNNIGEQDTN